MKYNLQRPLVTKTIHLDSALTERFKDRNRLIATLNAMRRRNPKISAECAEVVMKLHQGWSYQFQRGYVHCNMSRVKMF